MKRVLSCLMLLLALTVSPTAMLAEETEDNTFGGWIFTEVNHDFTNGVYLTGYFEHDNYQFKRLECNYFRLSGGYKIMRGLKVGLNYVPVCEPGNKWLHYSEVDIVGSLRFGDFKLSLRERYRHGFSNDKNELRSRLKLTYKIPHSRFDVYVAPEVFTWGKKWTKTRHYVGCTYDITHWMQAEAYYMYYLFKDDPSEHVIGLGLNFDL